MSSAFVKINPFVENLAEKVFNLGSDSLKIALANAVPSIVNGRLSEWTEVSYTNLSSRVLTTVTSAQTSGTYKLVVADLVLTASGGTVGPFRYVIVFSDTATNDEVLGYFDYGSSITLQDGETITIDTDQSGGLLTIA